MQRARPWRVLAGAMILALLTGPCAFGQTTTDEPEKKPAPPAVNGDKKPAPLGLDALRIPAGAILVLCEQAKDVLQLLPRMIVMTPENYQKLQDQIEQLRRQAHPAKPVSPSICKLKARIDGELARIERRFEFRTVTPRTAVQLGCQKAWPISAKMDGATPWLQMGDEGLILIAETPGAHTATVELLAPLTGRRGLRGIDRGFELDLPRAAITLLERLDLPEGVAEARLGARTLRTRSLDGVAILENQPVVPIDHLEVSWRGPVLEPPGSNPILASSQRIVVRVTAGDIVTDTEVTLRVLRGEAALWQVRLLYEGTPSPELKPAPQEEGRIQAIESHREGPYVVWDVRLKEPSAEPLRLNLRVHQPRSKGRMALSALVTTGARAQRGEIELRAPEEFRLYMNERPELSRRELTDEQRRDNVRAVYVFGSLPAPQGQPAAGQTPTPFFTVQFEEVKGAVEARVTDQLRLLLEEREALPGWQATTRLEVTPLRTGVDRFEFSLPQGFQLDRTVGPTPADLVEDVVPDPANQRLLVKLIQRQTRPFSFTLPGFYPLADARAQDAVIEMPRPLTWGDEGSGLNARTPILDRGAKVIAQVPDSLELVDPPRKSGLSAQPRGANGLNSISMLFAPPPTRAAKAGVREYTWYSERLPKRIDLAWHPYRPELTVDSTVDISLSASRARVRQRLRLQFPQTPPTQVTLRGSPHVELAAVAGGRFVGEPDDNGDRDFVLQSPVGPEHTVQLEYALALADQVVAGQTRSQSVPLFQAVAATRGRTRVRIWSDADLEVLPEGKEWQERPTEVVPDRDSLPALVLDGGLAGAVPVRMRMNDGAAAALLVDRALVRVTMGEDGRQAYRARFLIQRIADHRLDLEFPVPLNRSAVVANIADKRIPITFLDDLGRETDVGRVGRLAVEPELYRQPVVLEVYYTVLPGRLEETVLGRSWLRPVLLPRAIFLGRVRWQVETAPGVLPLLLSEGYTRESRWGWHGWLWGPCPAADAAELDQWLLAGFGAPAPDQNEPGLVCWRTSLAPLGVTMVPLRVWLLVCSLLLLGLFLIFTAVPLRAVVYWPALLAVVFAVAGVVLAWPDLLSMAILGCEPGLAVLLVLLAVRGQMQRRAHQQVVFMPGFQSRKKGSSIVRNEGSKVRRELSTVDAPPQRASAAAPEPPP